MVGLNPQATLRDDPRHRLLYTLILGGNAKIKSSSARNFYQSIVDFALDHGQSSAAFTKPARTGLLCT